MLLSKLKETAESYIGKMVDSAVITAPVLLNHAEKQATTEAAEMAGLNVTNLIDEPKAAALAYGLNQSQDIKTIVVFALGGGTLDVSVLGIKDGVFQVKATYVPRRR